MEKKMTEYKISAKYKNKDAGEQKETVEIDLLKLAKAWLKKLWLILLIGVLAAGLAYEYTALFVAPTYKSSVKMYVDNVSLKISGASLSISGSDISAAKTLVQTYIEILQTRLTLERVIDDANLKNSDGSVMSYATLKGKISASSVNNTEIFQITVTDTDPDRAMLIANTIAEDLPYQIAAVIGGSSVKTVDWAVRGTQASPNLTKNALMGFLIGSVAVLIAVTVLFLTDRYIHDEEYLLENYNIPLLAVIPDLRRSSGGKYGKYKYKRYGYGKYGGYKKRAYGYYRERIREEETPVTPTDPKTKK